MENQNKQLLKALKSGRILTPFDALNEFNCFRLSARIYDLKNKGWPIQCERRVVDGGKVVGHYWMHSDRNWWPSNNTNAT